MPDNLFYNTTAAGVIVVLNKRKPESKKGTITLVNASKRFTKGRPKNHLADEDVADLARLFNSAESVEGEVAAIDLQQAADADYNLSPSRWVQQASAQDHRSVQELLTELVELDGAARQIDEALAKMLVKL